jgi:CSLREA domain-containing protein
MAIGACGLSFASMGVAHAATITVTTDVDDVVNNGNCTFREAVKALNTSTVVDACAAGNGSSDLIVLPFGGVTFSTSGNISILKNVTIDGSGWALSQMDFRNNSATLVIGDGGASKPTVSFSNMLVTNNGATGFWVRNGSTLFLNYVKMLRMGFYNVSNPGCILVDAGAASSINASELRQCTGFSGGAVQNAGTFSAYHSGFIENNGEHGGTVANSGTTSIYNSTFAKNTSRLEGAAIYNTGGVSSLSGCTVAYNTNNTGGFCNASDSHCGTIYNYSGTVYLTATIVTKSTSAGQTYNADCSGVDPDPTHNVTYTAPVTSLGYNLLGEFASNGCPKIATDLAPQDAQLQTTSGTWPVDGRGGASMAYIPAPTSPVLNFIPGSQTPCAIEDQRQIARGKDGSGKCDIGSVEASTALLVVDNTPGLSTGDSNIQYILNAMGYAVQIVDDDVAVTSSANGKQLVVISDSVTSSKILAKFRDITSGVVVMETALFDDMKMTGTAATEYGTTANQTQVLASGPLSALAGYGTASIYLSPVYNPTDFGWGKAASNAIIHARLVDGSNHPAVFEYPKGYALVGGGSAAGPRLGLYALSTAALDTNGVALDQEVFLRASH